MSEDMKVSSNVIKFLRFGDSVMDRSVSQTWDMNQLETYWPTDNCCSQPSQVQRPILIVKKFTDPLSGSVNWERTQRLQSISKIRNNVD